MSLAALPQPMEQRRHRMNDAITPFTLAIPQADLEDPQPPRRPDPLAGRVRKGSHHETARQ
jgi:hypothetical protein